MSQACYWPYPVQWQICSVKLLVTTVMPLVGSSVSWPVAVEFSNNHFMFSPFWSAWSASSNQGLTFKRNDPYLTCKLLIKWNHETSIFVSTFLFFFSFVKTESEPNPACLYSLAWKSLTLRQLQVSLTLLLIFFTLLPLPFGMLPMTTG